MYFQANSIFFIPFTLVLLLEIVATTTIKNSRQKQVTINYKKGEGQRLSAYYPVYNSDFQLPSAINYTLYTDLIFFVATTQPNYTVGFGNVNPRTWEKLAVDFVKRSKSAGVKPRFAVGGWTDSRYFSDLVLTDKSRKTYAQSLTQFGHKYGFEGLDIDWEFPSQSGIGCNVNRPEDIKNFGLFASEMKKVWPDGELSAAVNVAGITTSDGSMSSREELALLSKSLDYINIMAYDVYGGWSTTSGPNAPMSGQCSDVDNSVENAFATYKLLGFKESQMVMGIPGYGRAFTLKSPILKKKVFKKKYSSMLYQEISSEVPTGGQTDDKPGLDVCGNQTTAGGIWRFNELLQVGYLTKDGKNGNGGFTRHFDNCSGTPYLVKNTTLISYDDEESTIEKTKFAKKNNLAGVFFFDTEGPSDSVLQSSKVTLQQRYTK